MLELQYLNERLLHFIWQFQYYNSASLVTDAGEPIKVIKPGQYNTHQGPDFLEAVIQINQITLVGNVEIHVQASDWLAHQHENDPHFKNVILHVVWQNNKAIPDASGNSMHTLSLCNRVSKLLLEHYQQLLQTPQKIPCSLHLPALSYLEWMAWKERLAVEKLMGNTEKIIQKLHATKGHWEAVFWQVLAYNFGLTQNALLFQEMAALTPVNILAKHKNNIQQLEALLLGQANLLNRNDFEDKYVQMLQKEYLFLQKKYSLKPANALPKFLRMRPANFPTVRLAQLAMLIHQSFHLFDAVKKATTIQQVSALFNVTANDYWHYHYNLTDEPTAYLPKKLGRQMINTLIINTVSPMLFAYGHYHNDDNYKNKVIQWLTLLPAEKNLITSNWLQYQIPNKNAFDSQAFIHLSRQYCSEKKCLSCMVGHKILKQTSR